MRAILATIGAALALTTATAALAQNSEQSGIGVFVAPQISTLGFGIEAGYRINEYLGIRGNANFFNMHRDYDTGGIDYNGKAALKSFGATADVFPFAGGFHLSGGLRFNYNKAELSATPGRTVTINGNSYAPSDIGSLDGKIDFNRVAPYLGVGWMGSVLSPDIHLGADLGVMLQGRPKVTLTSSGMLISSQLAADLERERLEIQNDLKPLRFYPVVSVSIGYRF